MCPRAPEPRNSRLGSAAVALFLAEKLLSVPSLFLSPGVPPLLTTCVACAAFAVLSPPFRWFAQLVAVRVSVLVVLHLEHGFLSSLPLRSSLFLETAATYAPPPFPYPRRQVLLYYSPLLRAPIRSFSSPRSVADYHSRSTEQQFLRPAITGFADFFLRGARRFPFPSCVSFCVPARASVPLLPSNPLSLFVSPIHLSGLCFFSN